MPVLMEMDGAGCQEVPRWGGVLPPLPWLLRGPLEGRVHVNALECVCVCECVLERECVCD